MKRTMRLLVISLVFSLLLPSLGPARALDKQTRLEVMSSVVQVSLVRVQAGEVYFLPWGSGTIISADGLILTNCHVADPIRFGFTEDQVPAFDYLGIGLTVKSDRPPQLTYLAKVVQADPVLDLAVIRIAYKMDQSPVKADDLNLPYVELGDSDAVEVGDDLNVFGYPGIGGETVTFTKGVVSGFTLDAAIDGRAWVKTDAAIAGGNSGGTGVDENGLLIGVPTRAGVGGGTEPVDCRPIKDTNGDGRIDGNDACVPIGGFINALRPVNLAKPLIEAARLGLPDTGKQASADNGQPPLGNAQFSNLFFSADISEFDQPSQIVTSLPSGVRSLYLFFDYENMTSSVSVEMKVLVDGQERPDWGLPAAPWGGDAKGLWWIGWGDASFADGTYELVLYADGNELNRAQIQIGGAPQTGPSLANLTLSLEATPAGDPKEPAIVFPSGSRQLMAFFDYDHMTDGLNWSQSWLMDGQEIARKDQTWRLGATGRSSLTLSSQSGLEPGTYRAILTVDGELAALSDFWVSGDQRSGQSFGPVTFATGIDKQGNPVGAAQSFASGLNELHAFSSYSGMTDGVGFQVNWYIDDGKVIEEPYPWDGGESGDWHYRIYSTSGALPDGKYTVELLAEGQTLQTATTTVGTGQQPTPTPPRNEDGVQLQGHILDLDTGRPIPGATFLVLNPGITLATFEWTDAELFTMADADQKGYYELPVLLQRGECYTVIVGADGYWTYGEDDVCFTENSPSPLDVPVSLEKQ